MKVKDIAKAIENLAPTYLAYDFDNVGILVGDKEAEVKKVMLCLDLDEAVALEAVKLSADMIVAHHPIMFNPVKTITTDTDEGRAIRILIKNDINYYAAHTNLDVAKGGLNDLLSEKLGLKNTKALSPIHIEGEGIGRIGEIEGEMTLIEYCEAVKKALNCQAVKYSGDEGAIIKKVAVNTGGGASCISDAIKEGADVLVTGDFKYNQVRDCTFEGMNIIDVCHYDSEIICAELFYKLLSEAFGDNLEIVFSTENKNVVKFA